MCAASRGFGFEVTLVSCTLNVGVLSSRLHGLLFIDKNRRFPNVGNILLWVVEHDAQFFLSS